MRAPPTIICPDCGGTCGLLGSPGAEEDFEAGEVVAYRCPDCLDRWDVVLDEDDDVS